MPTCQGRPIRRFAGAVTLFVLAACATGRHRPAPVDGRTAAGIAYDVRGAGAPVVLIHGAFLDRRQWDPQRPLERELALIRYDTRWHGRSAGALAPFAAADDLLGVLDTLGVPDATLVGLSNGARIAVEFALTYPDRVNALVLVSPEVEGLAPTEYPAFWKDLATALARGNLDAAATVLAHSPVMTVGAVDSAWIRQLVRQHAPVFAGNRAFERRPTPSALDRLGDIRVPTLVVTGGADLLDIRRAGREIASRVPGAVLMEFDDAPHLLTVTHRERFNQALLAFLARAAAR